LYGVARLKFSEISALKRRNASSNQSRHDDRRDCHGPDWPHRHWALSTSPTIATQLQWILFAHNGNPVKRDSPTAIGNPLTSLPASMSKPFDKSFWRH